MGGRSLEILKHLKNQSHTENTKVKIICLVKNATVYHWYKGDKELYSDSHFDVNGSQLIIRTFTKTLEDYYICEGKDESGNIGKTKAYLRLRERDTWCTYDATEHSPKDYPPKAENLKIAVVPDIRVKPWPDIMFAVHWTVPRQGRTKIWGWQIRIFGMSEYSLGYIMCYQINKRYDSYQPLEKVTENKSIVVPYALSTYVVKVQSLPYLPHEDDHDQTVVQKEHKTPGLCDLRNIKACCESYINLTVVSKDNKARLNWTTYYPKSLNITIDAFVITWWIDEPTSDNCGVVNEVVLDPARFNYTFRNLTSKCGRNYTIVLRATFTNNPLVLGCSWSQPEVNFYQLPGPKHSKPSSVTPIKESKALATAGFTIAVILGVTAIAALVYICVKKRINGSKEEALGMENERIDNTRITSSSFRTGLPPEGGRLNGTSCWSAGENDKYQWIQVDLCKERVVTAIATQGRKNAEEWVVSYAVSYSLDRENFKNFEINGEIEVFSGNSDKNTVVTNVLSPPITARYIRIHPQSWYNRISMRMELYGSARLQIPKGDVSVFILNSNHCDRCIQVVHALAVLLVETGYIHCEVDIFAPMQEKSQGLARWTQEMISKSDYVIVPWMCEINPSKGNNTCKDMNTLIFLSSLDVIHAELVRNRNRKDKYIPVCLDHCPLDVLPPMQVHLPTYNIPSRINDLVVELLGRTRLQPDSKRPLLEFDDDDYKFARRKLEQAINSCHRKSCA